MSKLRKYRQALRPENVRVAKAMQRMVNVAGCFSEVKRDFPGVFERAFTQATKEVFEPAGEQAPV